MRWPSRRSTRVKRNGNPACSARPLTPPTTDNPLPMSGHCQTPTHQSAPGLHCASSRFRSAVTVHTTTPSCAPACGSSCWSTAGGPTAPIATATACSKEASSDWTTLPSSIGVTPSKTAAASNNPMAPPGWGCSASTCWRHAFCSQKTERNTRVCVTASWRTSVGSPTH